jgi:hypothetical protein
VVLSSGQVVGRVPMALMLWLDLVMMMIVLSSGGLINAIAHCAPTNPVHQHLPIGLASSILPPGVREDFVQH